MADRQAGQERQKGGGSENDQTDYQDLFCKIRPQARKTLQKMGLLQEAADII